jgi:hypothetical protein
MTVRPKIVTPYHARRGLGQGSAGAGVESELCGLAALWFKGIAP